MRETERRAQGPPSERRAASGPDPVELHPDLAEALAAAEDALHRGARLEVRSARRGDGCRAEIEFDSPPRRSSWPSGCCRARASGAEARGGLSAAAR